MVESEQGLAKEDAQLAPKPEEPDPLAVGQALPTDGQPQEESASEGLPAGATLSASAQRAVQPRTLAEIIPAQLVTLRRHHYAVLATEEVEAVHKMRVTTRRLQASLDLLEGQVRLPPLKRRLRKWRRMLSTVRNYDVFLILVEQEAASRRGAREQYDLLKAVLQKRRAKLAARVKKYLAKVEVVEQLGKKLGLSTAAMSSLWEQPAADVVDTTPASIIGDSSDIEILGLATESAEPEAGDIATPGSVLEAAELRTEAFPAINEQAAAVHAAERLEQRMAEFNALVARSHPTTDPSELHQLRIAAKRIRYLMETVTAMGFGDASQALAWLRGLQDRIGDWHDLEALEGEIIGLVSRRKFTKEHLAEAAGLLVAATHLQKRKRVLVSRLFPVRVPATLSATSRRLVRALRRSSASSRSFLSADTVTDAPLL